MPHTNAIKPSANRWKYLKALRPAEPRMVHVSAEIVHVPDPDNPMLTVTKVAKGTTYNIGRNKAKGKGKGKAHG